MNTIDTVLSERRTIRKYSERDVDDFHLRRLLELAFRASTTGNMQVYSVVITRDRLKKAELSPAHFNQPMVKEAPVVLTFCADFNRFNTWCRQRKADPGYDNFLSFFTAAIDALLVAQTFCIAAEAEGLGICYLGTTTYNASSIIKTLSLPEGVVPVTTITLGWPDGNPEQTDRLPYEAIVHTETYNQYTADSIDNHYKEKEERADSQRFIEENKKETLAQVFADIRYTRKDNEYFSGKFLEAVIQQGFKIPF